MTYHTDADIYFPYYHIVSKHSIHSAIGGREKIEFENWRPFTPDPNYVLQDNSKIPSSKSNKNMSFQQKTIPLICM